jgi:DNA-binding MarR family transcriptional regulator
MVDIVRSGAYSSPVNQNCKSSTKESAVPLAALLLRAAQRIEGRIEAALTESGLSFAKLGVLSHLVEAGRPLPLGQLAGRIACVKSNMTQLVDRLEADGLVSRVNDPEDRRSVLAAITGEGRKRFEVGVRALASKERELFAEFSAEERKRLLALLKKLGSC